MCNLSQGIRDRGRAEGIAEGIESTHISVIKQMMKNLNFTAEQAMSAIGLSEKDKIHYMSIINKEN